MNQRSLRVIVVGGGIGGLTSSLLLARGGAEVTLVDPGDGANRGAALLLQPNGLAVLRAVGLDQALEAAGHRVETRAMHGADDQVLGSLRMPDFGHGLDHGLCVRRGPLLELLETAAARSNIDLRRGEVTQAAASGSVTYLEHGRPNEEHADLVIGADGVRSIVRAHGTFGARGGPTGRSYVRGLVATDTDPGGEHWTPLGVFGGAPAGLGLAYFYCSADAPQTAAALAAGDLEAFRAAWTAALPSAAPILTAVDGLDDLLVNRAHRIRCDRWVDGRLVLLGDAAHAMEPLTGQGANSALVDAAVLALELQRPGTATSDALRRYEERRRPAVLRTQRTGDRLALLASLRGGMSTALRDVVMRALSRPAVLTREIRAAQQEDPARLLDQLLAAEPPTYEKGEVSWS